MKNNLLKVSILTFGLLILSASCNQSKKSSTIKNKNEIVNEDFKLKTPEDTTKFETTYNDGRITVVNPNFELPNGLEVFTRPL